MLSLGRVGRRTRIIWLIFWHLYFSKHFKWFEKKMWMRYSLRWQNQRFSHPEALSSTFLNRWYSTKIDDCYLYPKALSSTFLNFIMIHSLNNLSFNLLRLINLIYFTFLCRKYRTGYIWQDLLDDDLITPMSDNEYVLKGSEISSSTFKFNRGKSYHQFTFI